MKFLSQLTTIFLMAFLLFSCGSDDNSPAPMDDDGPIGMDDDVLPPPTPTATAFKWETAEAEGNSTTETLVDGTVLTTTNNAGNGIEVSDEGGLGGSTANIVKNGATTSVTFNFDTAVDVNSILPIETGGQSADYIFARVGGAGVSPIKVTLVDGAVDGPALLNWSGVTSFSVTTETAVAMGFDDLIVNEPLAAPTATAFKWETAVVSGQSTIESLVDGTTLIMTNDSASGVTVSDEEDLGGSSANIAKNGATTSVTFEFGTAVNVNSILPLEAEGQTVDYIFTRVDGSGDSPITVSLVDGVAPGSASVDLNWTDVTSFTVTAATDVAMAFDDLTVNESIPLTINFGWETAIISGDQLNITETIDGITLTTSSSSIMGVANFGGWMSTTANILSTDATSSVTFAFTEAVTVKSILPLELSGADADFTFTPSGEDNLPITVSMSGAAAPDTWVDLNWKDVTSFTVTASTPVRMGFDDLDVRVNQD